jgi:hypothetical protein
MPMASDATAVIVNKGCRTNNRSAFVKCRAMTAITPETRRG